MVAYIISRLFGYVFRILLARRSEELYGVYSLTLSLVDVLLPFALFGLIIGVVRYMSYHKARGDIDRSDLVASSALKVIIPLSTILAVLTYLASDGIARISGVYEMGFALKVAALMLVPVSLSYVFFSILRAEKMMARAVFIKDGLLSILRVMSIPMMIYLGFSMFSLGLTLIVPVLVSAFLLYYYSRGLFAFKAEGFDRELLFFSMPMFFLLVSRALLSRMDTILIGFMTNIGEVAAYNVSIPTASLPAIFTTSLIGVYLPVITAKFARRQVILAEYRTVTKWVLISSLPFLLVFIFFGGPVISALFGGNYAVAVIPLALLALSYFLDGMSSTSVEVLLMLNKPGLVSNILLATVGLNVVFNLMLIPFASHAFGHGMFGAAFARLLALSFSFALSVYYARTLSGLNPFDRSCLLVLSAAAVCTAVFIVVYSILPISTLSQTILFFSGYFILYCILLLAFKAFDDNDRSVMRLLMGAIA
jgi:O-antigen/teichoic acid export membrane protein